MQLDDDSQGIRSLVVFDLDGTLIDSRRDLADAANALILEYGGQPQDVETIAGMVGEGAALLVKRALRAAQRDVDLRAALARFLELYDERLLAHTTVYEGINPVLAQLHRQYQLGLLTNKPLRATRSILEGLGLARYFDQVFGGDGPHARKPDPGALAAMMEAAGATPAGTCMVGDSRIDLSTARAAGTHIVLAGYGFGFSQDMPPLDVGELVARTPAEIPESVSCAFGER